MTSALRRMKRAGAIAAVALLGAGASGCSDHPLYGAQAELRIQLTPENPVLSSIGQSRQLTVTALDRQGRAADPAILLWETTNPEVATVDGEGRVTALRDGIVVISVRAGSSGYAETRVYVDATVRSGMWISAVANRDPNSANDRDSTSMILHARSSR